MPNLSIKSVPEDLAERLRAQALRNHRSLQGELMAILEAAVAESPGVATRSAALPKRTFAAAALSFKSRIGAEASAPLGASLESTALLREMRDQRYGEAGERA